MDKFTNKLSFNHNRQQTPPQMPAKPLSTQNCPNNSYALANVVAVNPADFDNNVHVAINDFYVFTTRHSTDLAPGQAGLNGSQRLWLGVALGEEISVRRYDIQRETGRQPYIGTLNLEISFKSRNRAVDTKFDQDDLAKTVIHKFESQVFTPSQLLFFDYKGIVFELRVQSIQVVDLSDIEATGTMSTSIEAKGLLAPQTTVNFFKGRDGLVNLKSSAIRPRTDAIIRPDFRFEDMGVGGLGKEFTQIFRRAFASRIVPPSLLEQLSISHVKGLLLYGPPGTGKTLIARKIGKLLNAKEPKIVNGPEILSKYVGSSEENIRNLFKDAEAEYKQKGEDSSLHIIIFDELDSVFKQRGSRGDGTGVGDNVVNQLLAKMDGVDQLNNILVIGMTNRLDLIDSALLRPGRFEVQVEIHLPDEAGRFDILKIHTKSMKENKRMADDVDLHELAALSKNFSGAEIEGLVRSASSFAINGVVKIGNGQTKINNKELTNIKVTRKDFLKALDEVVPAFGISEEDLKSCLEGGLYNFSPTVSQILREGGDIVKQVHHGGTRLLNLLVHGPPGSGKTALAASIAMSSGFPFIRLISPTEMARMSESAKIAYIDDTFRDAYKSSLTILVIDDIESIFDWSPIGPRFSNSVLQTLLSLLKKKPPKDGRLLIITTTSSYSVLKQLDILRFFQRDVGVPNVKNLDEFNNVMIETNFLDDESRIKILNSLSQVGGKFDIGIKKVLYNIEAARTKDDPINGMVDLMVQSS